MLALNLRAQFWTVWDHQLRIGLANHPCTRVVKSLR